MDIRKGMYGPLAGILAIQLLKKRLVKYDYYEVQYTPALWKHHTQHTTNPIHTGC